jgi:hypothetical protein
MNSGRFQKGFTPWNKGIKKSTGESTGESKSRFKKGNETWNTRPLGDEHIDSHGYIRVKVVEAGTKKERWKLKHRLIYEQHYGEITGETLVKFYDDNKQNVNIENLYAVTKGENVVLNRLKFANEPVELKPTILTMVRMCLKAKIPYRVSAQ